MRNTQQTGREAPPRTPGGAFLSAAIHAVLLIGIAAALHRTAKLEPHRMPGTPEGLQRLTYYAPGNTHAATSSVQANVVDPHKPTSAAKPLAGILQSAAAADAQPGGANAGQSGLGDGNITIALQKYFPYPKPSLTSLSPGAAGDVVLKAVIDEHGKIAGLTLLVGLGPAIDNDVIQTVNQWTYTPATKDGVPVASVEELHFHYERRG